MKLSKKFLLVVIIILGVYIIMINNGHDLKSIINTPKKIELVADCSQVRNLLIVSNTNLTISNKFNRTHKNVKAKVIAYDKNENIIKERLISFNEILKPNNSLSKLIRLPAKTKKCKCLVVDSNPF